MTRTWTLTGIDGLPYESDRPGTLGGHHRSKLYGRLDCRAARRAIERGGYVRDRVFFADEATARDAGYRPCAVCLPEHYAAWNAERYNYQNPSHDGRNMNGGLTTRQSGE